MTKQQHKKPGTKSQWRDSFQKNLESVRKSRQARKDKRRMGGPHRSFRLSHSRDYKRSLQMPGYVGFTVEVFDRIWQRKRIFVWLAILYATSVVIFGGMTSQSSYVQIQDIITNTADDAGGDASQLGAFSTAGFVLLSAVGGDGTLSDVQQIYLALAVVLVWLAAVWLLREQLAGRKPRLRDGLYNSGAPLISTFLVALVFLLQLVPFALAAVVYAGLVSIGLASQGFGAMIAVLGLSMVGALTLYWLTSTFIALVVVTLPGMYPLQAMRVAGSLVVSRRLRVLYRLLWMIIVLLVAWVAVMIPLIIIESWLRSQWAWLDVVPIIPFLITIMSAISSIWVAAYIYLFYRKLVDDESVSS